MGRTPCCDKSKTKRGPWSPQEDAALKNYLHTHGNGGNWISLPHKAGLTRCGKSCRLRWLNYLRPNIKHGSFTEEEDNIICTLYNKIGSRWSVIASQLPGRTDNDVKNHWNTKLKKKLLATNLRSDVDSIIDINILPPSNDSIFRSSKLPISNSPTNQHSYSYSFSSMLSTQWSQDTFPSSSLREIEDRELMSNDTNQDLNLMIFRDSTYHDHDPPLLMQSPKSITLGQSDFGSEEVGLNNGSAGSTSDSYLDDNGHRYLVSGGNAGGMELGFSCFPQEFEDSVGEVQ